MNTNKVLLFIDTETNGLPVNFKASATDVDNWPRVVQVAWAAVRTDGTRIGQTEYILRPEGFEIPKEASDVHGITTERAIAEGVDAGEIFAKLARAVELADVIVAHNVDFDAPVLQCEFIRRGIRNTFEGKRCLCTMKSASDFCAIHVGNGRFKWPKLQELHRICFGEGFEDAHSALADVEATIRCFFELAGRKVITIN